MNKPMKLFFAALMVLAMLGLATQVAAERKNPKPIDEFVKLECEEDDVPAWNAEDEVWECATVGGVLGREIKEGTAFLSGSAGLSVSGGANCSAGKVALGGGCELNFGAEVFVLEQNTVTTAGDGWACSAKHIGTNMVSGTLKTKVICANAD